MTVRFLEILILEKSTTLTQSYVILPVIAHSLSKMAILMWKYDEDNFWSKIRNISTCLIQNLNSRNITLKTQFAEKSEGESF